MGVEPVVRIPPNVDQVSRNFGFLVGLSVQKNVVIESIMEFSSYLSIMESDFLRGKVLVY